MAQELSGTKPPFGAVDWMSCSPSPAGPGEVSYFLGSRHRSCLRLQSSWGQRVIDQSHVTRLIFPRWSVWCLIRCRYVLERLFSDVPGYRENLKNSGRRDTGTSVCGVGNVTQRSVRTRWQLAYWSPPPDWWGSARVPSRVPSCIVRMSPDPSLIPGSGPGSSELHGVGLLAGQEAWQVTKPGPPQLAALGHATWKGSAPCPPAQGQLCSLTAPFCF